LETVSFAIYSTSKSLSLTTAPIGETDDVVLRNIRHFNSLRNPFFSIQDVPYPIRVVASYVVFFKPAASRPQLLWQLSQPVVNPGRAPLALVQANLSRTHVLKVNFGPFCLAQRLFNRERLRSE